MGRRLGALLLGLRNAFYGVPVGERGPMTAAWAAILVASAGCYALKLAGVSLPDSVLGHPRVHRTASLLPVAMLTALVVTAGVRAIA